MPAIDATAGGASANSYATLAEADTFHSMRLHADAWTDADDSEQTVALQMATRLLDQWFEWTGFTSTNTQALLWPRSGVVGVNGYLEDNTAIPDRVRDATAELAMHLLLDPDTDRTLESDAETQGLQSITAGPVSLVFKNALSLKVIPQAVAAFLVGYGVARSAGGGSVRMYRA